MCCRFIIGPNIGGALGAANAAVAALGSMLASFLLIAVAVPESYPPKPAAATRGEFCALVPERTLTGPGHQCVLS